MRVVFDARRYSSSQGSGVGNYTASLMHALLKADKKIELILILRKKEDLAILKNKRVSAIYFDSPLNSPATMFRLGRLLKKLSYDLYHSPLPIAPLSIKKPYVVTVHDIMWMVNPDLYSKNKLHRFFYGKFMIKNLNINMKRASWLLTVSASTKRALAEYMPWYNSKISVSYNGNDKGMIYPLSIKECAQVLDGVLPKGQKYVLVVSSNAPYKNRVNAIKGYMEAYGNNPEYKLVVVQRFTRLDGDLKQLFADQRVKDSVILLPHVTNEVLNGLYNGAQVLLHPSYYEGFGMPLVEAMAVKTPVVTSNTSCLPEVVGEAALCVDPADPKAIGDALLRIEKDAKLRKKLIAAGVKRAAFFTWENCAKATLEGYRNALARSSK